ncbi:hypothetical protein QO001_002257 [Methylobacterium brachiatum]|jgi:hypothetical protein|uniref:Porin n=1 Tax=Methylobacterium brachiatum TaxID=269660 RepID=A0AAJ1TM83_9HYPH|nr:hypothetical protein [Methylobacterium brachiatum]MCB4802704.1 hypothetical protein [Methylobacterium brachiatum]MDF2600006.1 protein of unassigned function [Methylobacterium brachiatum]MDQ0543331.1 hypothetical protein [Methylobacterium brachiatum]
MTLRSFIVAALATLPMIGSALADEAIALTPPLYREQARAISAARPAAELATTPRLVPAAPVATRVVTATALPTR